MRIARTLAAASLTLGLVAAGAPAAQADPVVDPPVDYSNCQFSNGELSDGGELVVGTTHVRSLTAYFASSNCVSFAGYNEEESSDGIGHPQLNFGYDVGGTMSFDEGSDTADYDDNFGDISADPDMLYNSVAGKRLEGTIELPDGTTRSFPGPALTLKRKALISDTYAPSKVKKNKRFFMVGVLTRADWDRDEYTQYFKQTLRLQSRPSGGKWKTIQKLNSGKPGWDGGTYAYTKIKKNTCFRWKFDGSSTTSAVTSDTECVKIKK